MLAVSLTEYRITWKTGPWTCLWEQHALEVGDLCPLWAAPFPSLYEWLRLILGTGLGFIDQGSNQPDPT